MSTSYFTSVWADIPVRQTRTLVATLRKAANTINVVGARTGNAKNATEVARHFMWAVRTAFPNVEPQIETVDLQTGALWISGRIEEGLTDVGDMAARDMRAKYLLRKHRTMRGRALMAMAMPIDQAIRLLTRAKARIGGDKTLVFTTDSNGAAFNTHEDERYAETRLVNLTPETRQAC